MVMPRVLPSVWGGPDREEGAAHPGWMLGGPTGHSQRRGWPGSRVPWLWTQTCLDLSMPLEAALGGQVMGRPFYATGFVVALLAGIGTSAGSQAPPVGPQPSPRRSAAVA